jgi:hypothetical protein
VFQRAAGVIVPTVPGARLEAPLATVLRGFDDARLGEVTGSPPAGAPVEESELLPPASGEPLYAAYDVRDPFQSLLPQTVEPGPGSGAWGPEGAPAPPPSQGAPPSPPSLVIQGMLWGATEPSAIINDEVYRVGERVQGAVIRSIDRTGVSVEAGGSTWRLAPRAE